MTPTATYIAEENCLQELPTIIAPNADFYSPGQKHQYRFDLGQYNAHLATLRKIPCSPEPGFKGGEKYTEGVDYEIKGADEWKWCYQLKGNIFAAPIVPAAEENLWREVLQEISNDFMTSSYAGSWIETDKAIAELKSKYSLTKR